MNNLHFLLAWNISLSVQFNVHAVVGVAYLLDGTPVYSQPANLQVEESMNIVISLSLQICSGVYTNMPMHHAGSFRHRHVQCIKYPSHCKLSNMYTSHFGTAVGSNRLQTKLQSLCLCKTDCSLYSGDISGVHCIPSSHSYANHRGY